MNHGATQVNNKELAGSSAVVAVKVLFLRSYTGMGMAGARGGASGRGAARDSGRGSRAARIATLAAAAAAAAAAESRLAALLAAAGAMPRLCTALMHQLCLLTLPPCLPACRHGMHLGLYL